LETKAATMQQMHQQQRMMSDYEWCPRMSDYEWCPPSVSDETPSIEYSSWSPPSPSCMDMFYTAIDLRVACEGRRSTTGPDLRQGQIHCSCLSRRHGSSSRGGVAVCDAKAMHFVFNQLCAHFKLLLLVVWASRIPPANGHAGSPQEAPAGHVCRYTTFQLQASGQTTND
jgi:hypothetical protein